MPRDTGSGPCLSYVLKMPHGPIHCVCTGVRPTLCLCAGASLSMMLALVGITTREPGKGRVALQVSDPGRAEELVPSCQ